MWVSLSSVIWFHSTWEDYINLHFKGVKRNILSMFSCSNSQEILPYSKLLSNPDLSCFNLFCNMWTKRLSYWSVCFPEGLDVGTGSLRATKRAESGVHLVHFLLRQDRLDVPARLEEGGQSLLIILSWFWTQLKLLHRKGVSLVRRKPTCCHELKDKCPV